MVSQRRKLELIAIRYVLESVINYCKTEWETCVYITCSCSSGKSCFSTDKLWLNSWKSQKIQLLFCTWHQYCCFSFQPTVCSMHQEDQYHRSLISWEAKSQRYSFLAFSRESTFFLQQNTEVVPYTISAAWDWHGVFCVSCLIITLCSEYTISFTRIVFQTYRFRDPSSIFF